MRVPYMIVVGEKEMTENLISVRRQGKGDLGAQTPEEFENKVLEEIASRESAE